MKKYWVGVIGDAGQAASVEKLAIAYQLGKLLARAGYGIITGGMYGVMEAACKGAVEENGITIGILPHLDKNKANPYLTLAIPTPFGYGRNMLISLASDAVVAIGGGAGTLSEIAYAWMYGKLIIAFKVEGWSGRLANAPLDHRLRHPHGDMIYGADSVDEVINILNDKLPFYIPFHLENHNL